VHLKWAFSEAAALFLRWNVAGRKYFARIEKKHGKGKALVPSFHQTGVGQEVLHALKAPEVVDLVFLATPGQAGGGLNQFPWASSGSCAAA
jgi:hypothetical protein